MSQQQPKNSWVPHRQWLMLAGIVACVVFLSLSIWLPFYAQRRVISKIERLGGNVYLDQGGPEWLRNLVGDEWMEMFGVVTNVNLSGSSVKNEDLLILQSFPELTSLSLSNTEIDDAGIQHVAMLTKLERLDLYRSKIGNESLKTIKKLSHLTWLPMGETNVTDGEHGTLAETLERLDHSRIGTVDDIQARMAEVVKYN